MGRDPRQRQKARAKKLARQKARKERRRRANKQARSQSDDIGSMLERSPINKCYAAQSLFDKGLGSVVVTRTIKPGVLAVGVFLVDAYCLGIKNAFITAIAADGLQKGLLSRMQPVREISPEFARKIVDGALAYAEAIDLEPHDDFFSAEAIFGDIEADDATEEFTFGRNGKPCYINGPEETEEQIQAILAHLKEKCGEDGFVFERVSNVGATDFGDLKNEATRLNDEDLGVAAVNPDEDSGAPVAAAPSDAGGMAGSFTQAKPKSGLFSKLSSFAKKLVGGKQA